MKSGEHGFVKHYHFASVSSTNDFCKTLAQKESSTEAFIVSADQQTKGKGSHGRTWFSESTGGIYFSYCMFPKQFDMKKIDELNLNIGSIIKNVIAQVSQCKARVKPPNDVYINHKKVAGVLIESVMESTQVIPKIVIVGIGLNVNQKEFPAQICALATSLYCETKQTYEKDKIISLLSKQLDQYLQKYQVL